MERALFQSESEGERLLSLKNTADGVEEIEYMKPFEADEMAEKKETLSEVVIELADIAEEKAASNKEFAEREKSPKAQKALLTKELKEKASHVKEVCYKYFDENEKMVHFYNDRGMLVYSRPMTPKEVTASKQSSVPGAIREMRANG